VVVNILEDKDIKNYYEIIGALESVAILKAFEVLSNQEIDYMEKMNQEMFEAIKEDNFDLYYEKNLNFHNVYLKACGNEKLRSIVNNLKKRLYDFPRPKGFVKEWEEASIGEHAQLIDYLRHGQKEEAANFIRDVHWSYEVQKKYLVRYYQHLTQTE
jgi:DNA-binding GntR family transcriptional regulator